MKRGLVFTLIILFICSWSFAEVKEKRKIKADDLFNFKRISQPRFSPDGKWIAYVVTVTDKEKNSRNSDIWMIPGQGGTPIRLTTHEKGDSSPRWSPDGKYLAFISSREEKSQVWLFNTLGGEPHQLTKMNNGVSSFVWSPDSSTIAFIAKDPEPEKEDEKEKEKEKKKKPDVIVVNRLQHKRDGVGYLDDKRNHIWVIPAEGGEPKKLTDGQYDERSISFSQDGKEILFVSNRTENPDANQNTDIWAVEVESGKIRQITTNVGPDSGPSWSHDGKYVAYVASTNFNNLYGTTFLWVVPAQGGEPIKLTGKLDRNIGGRPEWSKDDKHIYFILEDSGNLHLCRIPSSGGEIERVVAGERVVRNPIISPDGQYLALMLGDTMSSPELYIAKADGEELKKLTSVNDEILAELKLSQPENIHYKSFDGQEIEGWVIKPVDFQPDKKYPMVVKAHGGPQAQYSTSFNHEFQLLAAEGYVVLYTNPRGSTGYGEPFCRAIWADWGNKDLKDVMAGVDYVIKQGYVDSEKLGVSGWSYGGIMTNYAITRTNRFQAAVSGASESDYFSCYGYDDLHIWWETELGLPWENFELYKKISPIFDVEKVKTSTLFMCGQNDYRCPLPQSEQMYLSLKKLGLETELVIYPGESHGVRRPDHQLDRLNRIVKWFNKYLKLPEEAKEKSNQEKRLISFISVEQ
ncbi:peptidase S9 [bacterium (candidate division B38) B3_B38]|nr:MAG: peptidase S9 [bacterium (candidate division B38) B3_B38]